ncbi:10286_t:CDS:2, partial [Cetraspora pellucida]
LFIAILVILCLGVRDELPIINRTYKVTNSLPIPGNHNCANFVNKSIFDASQSKYFTAFLPNSKAISYTGYTLTINITDPKYNISNQNDYMEMYAYDKEYDSKPLNYAEISFDDSLLLKNMYFFGQPRNDIAHYEWTFDRCIRHALIPDILSYFGRQKYIDIPYIDSHMSTVTTAISDLRTNNTYAILRFILNPPFIVTEETEERSKTILSLLGITGGVWGVFAAFYVFLFGPGLISPWGFVQKSKLFRNQYEKNVLTFAEEPDATKDFNSTMQNRLNNLEKRIQFYESYIIDNSLLVYQKR